MIENRKCAVGDGTLWCRVFLTDYLGRSHLSHDRLRKEERDGRFSVCIALTASVSGKHSLPKLSPNDPPKKTATPPRRPAPTASAFVNWIDAHVFLDESERAGGTLEGSPFFLRLTIERDFTQGLFDRDEWLYRAGLDRRD